MSRVVAQHCQCVDEKVRILPSNKSHTKVVAQYCQCVDDKTRILPIKQISSRELWLKSTANVWMTKPSRDLFETWSCVPVFFRGVF
ncbi:hypothetical protein RRG08_005337 [Elysia crispata]|uniref:Uncharacterized protein n=1 Tax=Elysia crispata TaxID=231223 RepID=A0AAE0Y740_9GAST|nr:hypothetical protein RRG08_005337 [Elysia crispata]